jgi:hypothetical protein
VDKLLPNDTEIIAGINVKQILNCALAKKVGQDTIKDMIKQQEMVQKVLDELGFDPFKDLDSIVAAWPNLSDTDKGLIIARGTFDIKKAKAKVTCETKGPVKAVTKPTARQQHDSEVTARRQPTAFVSLFSRTPSSSHQTRFLVNAIEDSTTAPSDGAPRTRPWPG